MQRLIFHVDVNSAFLSWEAARRVADGEPDLRLIPSAIGGDRDKRTGVILAKSIPAKKFGVTTGEPVAMALRKCPQLVLAKPDFALYTRNSKAFIAICRRFAPVVEQVSIDECFLDMTGTGLLYPNPIAIAHTIKDTIFSELGFTVNVGIAPNKLLTSSGQLKQIDISGIENEDLIEWEYIRYNLDAVRMPLGFCMKPKKQDCFTQLNPCLTCRNLCTTPDFLPQYEHEIQETKLLIERGKAQGREVWVEKNQHLLERYEEIVSILRSGQTRHLAGKKGREYIGEERKNVN